uniref:Disabled homolog 1-like n=1 Tax=Callorhinchus milii TaxID=7868 RepID=A0A4W3H0V0_CALMI
GERERKGEREREREERERDQQKEGVYDVPKSQPVSVPRSPGGGRGWGEATINQLDLFGDMSTPPDITSPGVSAVTRGRFLVDRSALPGPADGPGRAVRSSAVSYVTMGAVPPGVWAQQASGGPSVAWGQPTLYAVQQPWAGMGNPFQPAVFLPPQAPIPLQTAMFQAALSAAPHPSPHRGLAATNDMFKDFQMVKGPPVPSRKSEHPSLVCTSDAFNTYFSKVGLAQEVDDADDFDISLLNLTPATSTSTPSSTNSRSDRGARSHVSHPQTPAWTGSRERFAVTEPDPESGARKGAGQVDRGDHERGRRGRSSVVT